MTVPSGALCASHAHEKWGPFQAGTTRRAMTLEKPVLNHQKKLANSKKLCTSCMLEGNEQKSAFWTRYRHYEDLVVLFGLLCSDHLPWFCTWCAAHQSAWQLCSGILSIFIQHSTSTQDMPGKSSHLQQWWLHVKPQKSAQGGVLGIPGGPWLLASWSQIGGSHLKMAGFCEGWESPIHFFTKKMEY